MKVKIVSGGVKREREVMARIIAEINADIDRKYPQGIISEVSKEVEE